jgi:hypothetical protein
MSDFDPGLAVEQHKCPACRKEEDHYVMGIVYISGDFFNQRRDEIVNMLRNEEKKEVESLAVHLGRMLYHSYGGDVEYKFSDEQKLARVFWHRENKEVK